MAKKRTARQKDLIPGWDGLDPALKRAATQYKEASVAKSKATAKFKSKYDNLMVLMEEKGVPFVRIELDGVAKHIRLEDKHILKMETAKEQAPDAEDVDA